MVSTIIASSKLFLLCEFCSIGRSVEACDISWDNGNP